MRAVRGKHTNLSVTYRAAVLFLTPERRLGRLCAVCNLQLSFEIKQQHFGHVVLGNLKGSRRTSTVPARKFT